MWYQIFSKYRDTSYLTRHEEIALLFGLVIFVLVFYILKDKRKKKLPPGPIGVPIFGYYPFLGKEPEKTLTELAKKYGNVMGLYIGPKYIVFLNDWEAMRDGYGQKATISRPPALFEKVPFHFGVVGANGEEWVQTRRLSSRALKDVGIQNGVWEQLAQEEAAELVKAISQRGDDPLKLTGFFHYNFTNIIVTLIIGKRLHTGHSFTKIMAESIDCILQNTPTLGMGNFSSTLQRILQKLGLEKEISIGETINEFSKVISNTVDNIMQNPETEKDNSFISRFHEEIENHRKSQEKTLVTDDTCKGTVVAMLSGGSESGRSTILWTLIAMAENQDLQHKVHEELDGVLGREGTICWSERHKVPYTLATLMESMRWATSLPISTMRRVEKDTEVQGYHIPKGTYLTTNLYALHNDPRYWKEPERFSPERFLLDDGRKVNAAHESYAPFSFGKRSCPGKLLAEMEMLQYFCVLMQKFKVIPKEGIKVKHRKALGLTLQPKDAELRFIPRQ